MHTAISGFSEQVNSRKKGSYRNKLTKMADGPFSAIFFFSSCG
jgi:hypothetical protein